MLHDATIARTKTEAAFRTIRARLEDGHFKPGERLTVKMLADELKMSPTPIRESLRLLEAQGLVEHVPHHGVMVTEYSPRRAEKIYEARAALEPRATRFAAQRASDEQLKLIRATHMELEAAVESGSIRVDVASLNAKWHRAVYASADSEYIDKCIDQLWSAFPVEAIWLTRRGLTSITEHQEIMEALERRDALAAEDLMRKHIELGAQSILEHLRNISVLS